jgi:hypothetical protein
MNLVNATSLTTKQAILRPVERRLLWYVQPVNKLVSILWKTGAKALTEFVGKLHQTSPTAGAYRVNGWCKAGVEPW